MLFLETVEQADRNPQQTLKEHGRAEDALKPAQPQSGRLDAKIAAIC